MKRIPFEQGSARQTNRHGEFPMALFLRPKMALALLLKINYQDEDRPEEEGGGRQAGAVS